MSAILAGKNIVVGVTGSIAAFKVVGWVSNLTKEEAHVSVIMTEAAKKFITPLSFGALTGEKPFTAMFSENGKSDMAHIELAQQADLFLIAPATAHTIARLANGMADDLLSATVLATRVPVIVCPAMNSQMYLHPATQENLAKLHHYGYIVVDPDSGLMACKDQGPGRLIEWHVIRQILEKHLTENTLQGKRVLITAGPTREIIDPARFLSNRSSGKMGYALASEAYKRGAEVVLVSGPTELGAPFGVKSIRVTTAEEMYQTVMSEFDQADIIIKAAAVSDFRPAVVHAQKIKKDRITSVLELEQNPDILREIGERKREGQLLIGFAAESENIIAEAERKRLNKNLDMIVVNDITGENSGFQVDTNRVTILDGKNTTELPLTSKEHTAQLVWQHICDSLM